MSGERVVWWVEGLSGFGFGAWCYWSSRAGKDDTCILSALGWGVPVTEGDPLGGIGLYQ